MVVWVSERHIERFLQVNLQRQGHRVMIAKTIDDVVAAPAEILIIDVALVGAVECERLLPLRDSRDFIFLGDIRKHPNLSAHDWPVKTVHITKP